ncbi:bifunctional nuclease family protein [Microbacterium sp. 18062]|uniref:bifunctional nuclease family protein n=1 Tax=Microbacterium sp. 18062 TaxID=2681410 RepID=UPI00135AEE8E|nr:bifunctional nuclease family protein [Microbacterium sp. 18062]
MVRVRILGVALDAAEQHVILLKPLGEPEGSGRILPVWIGAQEATSILVAVEGAEPPRPLAHDLMVSLLQSLEGTVTRVEVTRIEDGTYYAEITLVTPRGVRTIDARPSDAIALASRTGSTIWVADDVLERAGILDTISDRDVLGDDDADAEREGDAEEEVEEFRRFLDDVDPEDFQG